MLGKKRRQARFCNSRALRRSERGSARPRIGPSETHLQPDRWTKIKIEVRGAQARLYVNDQPQPVLIANDVKSGPSGKGGVALWIGPGTVAHFRNLVVPP